MLKASESLSNWRPQPNIMTPFEPNVTLSSNRNKDNGANNESKAFGD